MGTARGRDARPAGDGLVALVALGRLGLVHVLLAERAVCLVVRQQDEADFAIAVVGLGAVAGSVHLVASSGSVCVTVPDSMSMWVTVMPMLRAKSVMFKVPPQAVRVCVGLSLVPVGDVLGDAEVEVVPCVADLGQLTVGLDAESGLAVADATRE